MTSPELKNKVILPYCITKKQMSNNLQLINYNELYTEVSDTQKLLLIYEI